MSQADNYTPQEVTGTTETLDVVLPWIFDGIDELVISQTDGTSVGTCNGSKLLWGRKLNKYHSFQSHQED